MSWCSSEGAEEDKPTDLTEETVEHGETKPRRTHEGITLLFDGASRSDARGRIGSRR
jgi:hypothetical protein